MRNKFKELEKIAKEFVKDEFNLNTYPGIDYLEGELGFAASLEEHEGKSYIVFSPDEWEYYEIDKDYNMLINVLLHECVRFAMVELNKPSDDNDAYFLNELYTRGLINDFEGREDIFEKLAKSGYEKDNIAKEYRRDISKANKLMEERFKKYEDKYLSLLTK